MALLLVLVGLLLLLLTAYHGIGVVLLVVGAILFFIPGIPYGYSSYRGPR